MKQTPFNKQPESVVYSERACGWLWAYGRRVAGCVSEA
jgi:hypothetical protein